MVTTAVAPTNIATLKYWGKNPAWEEYHIPTKSSLSFTVDGLYTKTTVQAKKGSGNVEFNLNRKVITPEMKEYEYVGDFLKKVGAIYPFLNSYDYEIVSENNFPTAAGFASSASGFAALIKAIAGEVKELAFAKGNDRKLSALARLGSGSATRSIPSKGGFVVWERGISPDDKRTPENVSQEEKEKIIDSSYSETLVEPDAWQELRIIYVKVKEEEKKVKSRAGMKTSVATSQFYKAWVEYEENEMKGKMVNAVRQKDFGLFAELTMKASNNLHSICLNTYPPISYLNETSWKIINMVHDINEGEVKAAYTYDAGPNAVVFTLGKHEGEVKGALAEVVGKENLFATRMGRGPYYTDNHLF
ncbi:MAG: diphosphomevalonate decarboxylase [Candidatus Anstonellales archaeon]